MKTEIRILIIILVLYVIYSAYSTFKFKSDTNTQLEDLNALLHTNQLKSDSLMVLVNAIEPTDISDIKNTYNIRYENEAAVIRSNDVSADILYFSEWYDFIKGY